MQRKTPQIPCPVSTAAPSSPRRNQRPVCENAGIIRADECLEHPCLSTRSTTRRSSRRRSISREYERSAERPTASGGSPDADTATSTTPRRNTSTLVAVNDNKHVAEPEAEEVNDQEPDRPKRSQPSRTCNPPTTTHLAKLSLQPAPDSGSTARFACIVHNPNSWAP